MNCHRSWIQSTLLRQETGAVPYNFSFSPPAQAALEAHYRTENLAETLELPLRMTGPESIKPLFASPARFGPTVRDEFGVVWTTNPIDRGVPVGPCLREPDLSGYHFPDPTAAYRFASLGAWCEREAAHYTIIWVGDLWERATFMRGIEELCLDVVLHPAFVEELLSSLAEHILRTMEVLFASFQFDGIAVSDDYGTQKSLLISPEHWRRFVKPHLAAIYGLAKAHGKTVFHHTCGSVVPIIPDLIEIGLDILHPIQPEAMDVYQLKRDFGAHLTLCGGVRTQDLLPHGRPEQVREEVRMLARELGRGGGYILEPGITLQADVPLANLVALVEEARSV